AKLYYPTGIGGKGGIQGFIMKDGRLPEIQAFDVLPITQTLRGLHPMITGIDKLKPSGATMLIDGAACEEYVLASARKSTTSYWLDPKKDYVLRRIQRQTQGKVIDQIDATYRRDKICGWVPTSWVRIQYAPDGTVASKTTFQITEMRLNEPPAPRQFDLVF